MRHHLCFQGKFLFQRLDSDRLERQPKQTMKNFVLFLQLPFSLQVTAQTPLRTPLLRGFRRCTIYALRSSDSTIHAYGQLLPYLHTTAYAQGIRATIEAMRTSGVEAQYLGTPEPQIEKAQRPSGKTEGLLSGVLPVK